MRYPHLKTIDQNLKKLAGFIKLPIFRFFSRKEKEYLLKIFAAPGLEPEVKLRIYELVLKLTKQKRGAFGFLLVSGWEKEWTKKYTSLPDASQNLFEEPVDLMEQDPEQALKKFMKITDFDGAVLVDKKGRAIASGVYLENTQPTKAIEKMGIKRFSDLSEAFGFYKKVHTRHLAGIACSYWLKNTLIYVVSEEDHSLRIFENGKIIYSPYKRETEWNQ